MLFNSIDFAIFCPVVFLLYWFVFNKNIRVQNLFILTASLFFYGWWDWRFLSLLIISAVTDYAVGIWLSTTSAQRKRKFLVSISITVNIGILAFFKYADFFIENFVAAYTLFGQPIEVKFLSIILPVGISFYTFQTLSYALDVYRNRIPATRDFIAFFSFISFFPQLVAGPIERAEHLLPQFLSPRKFEYNSGAAGLRQILWGLFKKVVVADNCGLLVDRIFDNPDQYSGSSLAFAVCLFSIQIYADFSGYSDIAVGTARLFGISLMQNFSFPYFATSFSDFWKRWHISLTSWFRDYVYIPLGGNRKGNIITARNLIIVFILSGLWHGAQWTFVAWGALNCIYLLMEIFILRKYFPSFNGHKYSLLRVLMVFVAISISWIFFRADSLPQAFHFLHQIFISFSFTLPNAAMMMPFVLSALMLTIEFWLMKEPGAFEKIQRFPMVLRWAIYFVFVAVIALFTVPQHTFIYFQF